MSEGELVLYRTQDGSSEILLRATEGTVWLTQAEIADLFDTTKQNVRLHLKNLFREGEIVEQSVVKDHLTTAADGKAYRTKQQRAGELNLAPEELAFYDAVAAKLATVYDQKFLASLIHDVVLAVKRNLKGDWTEPHRDAVQAEVRSAFRRVLRTQEVRREDFEYLVEKIMEQAQALYARWPLAA